MNLPTPSESSPPLVQRNNSLRIRRQNQNRLHTQLQTLKQTADAPIVQPVLSLQQKFSPGANEHTVPHLKPFHLDR